MIFDLIPHLFVVQFFTIFAEGTPELIAFWRRKLFKQYPAIKSPIQIKRSVRRHAFLNLIVFTASIALVILVPLRDGLATEPIGLLVNSFLAIYSFQRMRGNIRALAYVTRTHSRA